MAHSPIKTGLIGFGLSGRVFHAPFIHLLKEFELTAIARRHSQSPNEDYPEAEPVTTHHNILNNKTIELVVVATPNDYHYEMAKQALLVGKHVIIEKPFAPSFSQTEELIQIAKDNNLHLFVFHNRRWDGDFMTIKKILDNNLLGDIAEYNANYDRYKPGLNKKIWKETPSPGSGILYDLGTHIIDQAVCLFGKPSTVTAKLYQQRKDSRIDDAFDVRLDYPGLKVKLSSTMLAREIGPRYVIYGQNGSFIKYGIDPQEDDMQAGLSPMDDDWGTDDPENYGILNTTINGLNFRGEIETIPGNYLEFYKNVYEVIKEGKPYAITPESAQITTAIIEKAIESHESGRTIPLTNPTIIDVIPPEG